MTTIVTTTSTRYSVIVADQGITSDLVHPDMSKIVKQGTWLIGVCGESRVCDVLQYAVKYPKVPVTLRGKKIDEWFVWIVTRVVPQIQKTIQQNLHKDLWGTLGDSEAIITTHGHSFLLGETLSVTKAEPYWSIGSGGHLAMGSLTDKLVKIDWESKHSDYAKEAIEVAKVHDPYTRGRVSGYLSYPSGKIIAVSGQ